MGPASSGDYEQDGGMGALGREVGRRSVERLGSGLTRIVEESSALYRWMLTMLALLNGAAIYTAISAREAVGPDLFSQLVLIFFAGLMAALLAALAGMALTLPVASSIRRAITHWTDVSLTGTLSDEALAAAKHVRMIGIVWLSTISAIAFVSLLLFLVGAAIMAKQFGVIGAPADATPALEAPIADVPANAAIAPAPAARAPAPRPVAAQSRPAAAQRPATQPQRTAPVAKPATPAPQSQPVRTPPPAVVPSAPPEIIVPSTAPSPASPD